MNPTYTREDRPVFYGSWRYRFRRWLIRHDVPFATILALAVMATAAWILVGVFNLF